MSVERRKHRGETDEGLGERERDGKRSSERKMAKEILEVISLKKN